MKKLILYCAAIGLLSLLFAGYGIVNARINNPTPATAETDPIWTAASSTYLTTTTAASTYLTNAVSSSFAFLANAQTFTGATNTFAAVSATSLCLSGTCNASWPASGGGDLTFATQQAWTSVFVATRTASTTLTVNELTSALGTTTAGAIRNKLIQWTDSGGTTVKRGWVAMSSNADAVVTIEINGDAVAPTDTNFRVARVFEPQIWDWYVPGTCVADATNPVGKQYFTASNTTARLLSTDGNLGTAGVGTTKTLTYNIYAGSQTLMATAPDFTNTANVYDQTFTTTTVAGLNRVTLRTPACSFTTTTASDMNVNVYWAPNTQFQY